MEQSDNEGQEANKFINSGESVTVRINSISKQNEQDYSSGNRIVDVG